MFLGEPLPFEGLSKSPRNLVGPEDPSILSTTSFRSGDTTTANAGGNGQASQEQFFNKQAGDPGDPGDPVDWDGLPWSHGCEERIHEKYPSSWTNTHTGHTGLPSHTKACLDMILLDQHCIDRSGKYRTYGNKTTCHKHIRTPLSHHRGCACSCTWLFFSFLFQNRWFPGIWGKTFFLKR